MSRKVYIDLGAYDGDTIRLFRVDHDESWEVFAFEANPRHWEAIEREPNVTLHKRAVWINNDEMDFYCGQHDRGIGSSVMKEKRSGGLDVAHPTRIQGIDFAEWLKANFTFGDEIIVKMDIEGAEFEVIPRMIDSGAMLLVKELWVEIHPNKITKYTTTHAEGLKSRLRNLSGLTFKEWH